MSLAWSSVKALSIPVGGVSRDVKRVSVGGVTLWKKPNPLPYDAEVDYIESTGTQYIQLDIHPETSVRFSGNVYPISGHTGDDTGVFGNYYHGPSFRGTFFGWNANKWTSWHGSGTRWNIANVSASAWGTVDYTDSGANGRTFVLNGTTYTKSGNTTDFKYAGQLYHIFRGRAGTSGNNTWMRLGICKVYVDGVLVRDFIPVRKNGVGYLYDRANPTGGPLGNGLYPNSGTGAFVVGPDTNS